jgi:anti-sigma B factor antagonist
LNETFAALGRDVKAIEIDFSQTRTVDSCGLSALVSLQKAAEESQPGGIALRLLNPCPPVQQMLELTRLHYLFEIVSRTDVAHKGEFDSATVEPSGLRPHGPARAGGPFDQSPQQDIPGGLKFPVPDEGSGTAVLTEAKSQTASCAVVEADVLKTAAEFPP